MSASTTAGAQAPARELLQIYYARLHEVDQAVKDLTNFFFTVNAFFIGLVLQFARDDAQRFVLAVVGYAVTVAILCMTYKSYVSWDVYRKDMEPLETANGFDYVNAHYRAGLEKTPAARLSITRIRMRFVFAFLLFWLPAMAYYLYHYPLPPNWLPAASLPVVDVVVFLLSSIVPWLYFAGLRALPVIGTIIWTMWKGRV